MVAGAGLTAPAALVAAIRRELDAGRPTAPAVTGAGAVIGGADGGAPPDVPADLARLLALPRDRFVAAAYAVMLGREPDEDGARHYDGLLDEGRAGRIRVLGALAGSAEGQRRGTRVAGLARRLRWQRVYALPVAGRIARLLTALRAVPALMRDAEQQQEQLHRLDVALERARLDRLADRDALADLDASRRSLAGRLDRLGREMFELRAAADRQGSARDDLRMLAARTAQAIDASRRLADLLGAAGSAPPAAPVLALDVRRSELARRLGDAGLDGRVAVEPNTAAAAIGLDPLAAAPLGSVVALIDEAAAALRSGGLLVIGNTPVALIGGLLSAERFAAPEFLHDEAGGRPGGGGAVAFPLLVARRR